MWRVFSCNISSLNVNNVFSCNIRVLMWRVFSCNIRVLMWRVFSCNIRVLMWCWTKSFTSSHGWQAYLTVARPEIRPLSVCACVCVCKREKERETERESVCVRLCVLCVFLFLWGRLCLVSELLATGVRVCVCVCVRSRTLDGLEAPGGELPCLLRSPSWRPPRSPTSSYPPPPPPPPPLPPPPHLMSYNEQRCAERWLRDRGGWDATQHSGEELPSCRLLWIQGATRPLSLLRVFTTWDSPPVRRQPRHADRPIAWRTRAALRLCLHKVNRSSNFAFPIPLLYILVFS